MCTCERKKCEEGFEEVKCTDIALTSVEDVSILDRRAYERQERWGEGLDGRLWINVESQARYHLTNSKALRKQQQKNTILKRVWQFGVKV